jgi:hypothetical protein
VPESVTATWNTGPDAAAAKDAAWVHNTATSERRLTQLIALSQ